MLIGLDMPFIHSNVNGKATLTHTHPNTRKDHMQFHRRVCRSFGHVCVCVTMKLIYCIFVDGNIICGTARCHNINGYLLNYSRRIPQSIMMLDFFYAIMFIDTSNKKSKQFG